MKFPESPGEDYDVYSITVPAFRTAEHWGGHYTFDHDTVLQERDVERIVDARRERRHTFKAFDESLQELGNAFPLKTLVNGMRFDATEHPVGTITLLREEKLALHHGEVPNTNPSDETPPPREPIAPPSLLAPGITILNPLVHYTSATYLGVVAQPPRIEQPTLYTTRVSRGSQRWVRSGALSYAKESPVEIGATRHALTHRGYEVFSRVNILQIIEENGSRVPSPKLSVLRTLLRGIVTG